MQNRKVVLITNVKPGKLRDVASEGLVCVSCHLHHSTPTSGNQNRAFIFIFCVQIFNS